MKLIVVAREDLGMSAGKTSRPGRARSGRDG